MRLLISLFFFFTISSYASLADNILNNYQKNLYKLPLSRQEHFALRLYRITNNKDNLPPIIAFLHSLSHEYKEIPLLLENPKARRLKSQELLKLIDDSSEKRRVRIKKLLEHGDLYFYFNLLVTTHKIYSYHLENTPFFPKTEQLIKVINEQIPRFQQFILNKENIKIYGAQLINYIYYLHDLNLIDLRQPYTKLFQKTFPDKLDRHFSKLEYEGKIYGMTHFITAASHYYQHSVKNNDFKWISDYLENNIDQILNRTENDVIAEVGVCLMLVNKKDSIAVKKIKDYLTKQYNIKSRMIPTHTKSTDLAYGEHRNILTIMLFKWPKQLTKGPYFNRQLQLIKN